MVPDGVEMIVGVNKDPIFGPVVIVGMGGIFVEALEDVAMRLAPVHRIDALQMLEEIKGKRLLLIAEDFFLPNIPAKTPRRADIPVYAALISDIHAGSKMFMEDAFRRFLLWLNGKIGNQQMREIANHIKYVIIAGDLVDGVGIYPKQYEELQIKDIYEQYEVVAKLIECIPDYIEIVIIPGNHDAVRRALPQPAIKPEYAKPLYELDRVHLIGNPSTISLHGVRVLIYHGRSLDDIISLVPNMSFQEPDRAMRYLLESRHLAPIYGERTPIAPEKSDLLVVEGVPEIFHAGHIHTLKYSTYRGVLIVNSGAWQGQTEYQREMGHIPTPGIAPIVNLQTLEVIPLDFTKPL